MKRLESTIELFGSPRRSQVLLAVWLLSETTASELARLLDAKPFSIQQIVEALEDEGVVATRMVGRSRLVSLNPGYFARRELSSLLERLSTATPELAQAVAELRRRPRKRGKEL